MKNRFYMLLSIVWCCLSVCAQTDTLRTTTFEGDSIFAISNDSTFAISSDSVLLNDLAPLDTMVVDTAGLLQTTQPLSTEKKKRDWSTWAPNPKRALWLALVIPGGGQIYNRKFWKLPIVYGGFLGCIYALTWNNMMYKDYSQAYLDIMDDDPTTASYNKFLHLGRTIDDTSMERYVTVFKNRKDKYRRWRDMSLFVMIGIYALSVIDAYVDAELSVFDISKDLSLKVQPTVIGNPMVDNPIYASSLGVNCSLNF